MLRKIVVLNFFLSGHSYKCISLLRDIFLAYVSNAIYIKKKINLIGNSNLNRDKKYKL